MATTETKMTTERLDAFMDAWNAHDVDAIVGFFAEDCVFHPLGRHRADGRHLRGAGRVRRGVAAFFERYPDGRFEDASAFVAGDRGASEWTFVSGDTAVRGCDLFEFQGDRISVKNAFRKNRP